MNSHYSYQSTHTNWIGDIPSHWSIRRLKYLTQVRKELSEHGDEELLSVTESRGIVKRKELRNTEENISRSENLSGYRLVRKGDLVNNIMLVWKRGLGVSQYEGIVSPAYSVFTFNSDCDPYYFNYLMRSDEYISEFRRHSTGITMSRLRLYDDSFGNVFAHLPPIEEQKLISRYLDKKTSQIDSLVEKIQKKIELLKEQRTSLINHYVTKGLDPNAPMKDSGIEWIGEIPKHWVMSKIKWVTEKIGSGVTPKGGSDVYSEEGIPFLRSQNIHFNGLHLSDVVYISKEIDDSMSGSRVQLNDVLYNITGGSIGRCCLVTNSEPMNVNQHVCIVRPSKKIVPSYLLSILASEFGQRQLRSNLTGSGREGLNFENLGNFLIPMMSNHEQEEIGLQITNLTQKSHILEEKLFKKIQKLIEYRQSLISSVVTGKVRVTEDMI